MPYYLIAFILMLPIYASADNGTITAEQQSITNDSVVTESKKVLKTKDEVENTKSSLGIDTSSGSHFLQMIIGLFVVLLCILVLAWLAKKMNRFQSLSDDSLKIIGSLGMGTRERIVLLQVADQQLLVGVTSGQINTLHVLDSPVDVSNKQSGGLQGKNFAEKLKVMMTAADASSINKQSKK